MGDLLAKLDCILGQLAALRSEIAAALGDAHVRANGTPLRPLPEATGLDPAADFAPGHLIDTHSAQERFGHPRNTIARWCREEGLGLRQGGRWLVSVPRLRRWLNGG